MAEGIEKIQARGINRRALDKLSDREVKTWLRKARAGTASQKRIYDGGGLVLQLTPARSACWYVRYRFGGRERMYACGAYPEITLAKARQERARVRELLRSGTDPVRARRQARLDQIAEAAAGKRTSLEEFTVKWLERRRVKKNWSEIHERQVRQSLERYLIRRIGSVPIGDVTQPMVANAIEAVIARRKHESARKLLQNVALIFESAKRFKLRADNPADGLAEELMPSGYMPNRRPAFLNLADLGEVLRQTELARCSPQVRLALRVCAFSASRIGPVLAARWEEFNLDADVPVWIVPRPKMKAKRRRHDHKVILGPTIAAELRCWREITGGGGYLFPAPQGKAHLRHETVEKVYRSTLDLRGKHSVHGWRAAFSTLAKDSGLFLKETVDLALDHVHDSEVARAYDRGERLDDRIKLAYWWDAQLTAAQQGEGVVSIARAGAA